ncbi:MAG: TetR/AcrR family transcriptional regulator [Rhodospirillales bacterium]|jgi:TetR/AcrR family transcriptional regulator, regulator of autoinduction and epiphytic fitness|nr:TetR/AcrR family transcriptional regulator [Rhodospirillales bacterium]
MSVLKPAQLSVSATKRRQIVDAAIAEFQENGFAGTSMDRITERACVSKRTVYNHFENKEALFHAIIELIFEQFSETVTLSYIPGKPLRPQLVELGRAEGKLLMSESFMRLVRMAMGETMRDPALAVKMNERAEACTVFSCFMAGARDAGAMPGIDPAEVSEQFLGLIKARAFWPYVLRSNAIDAETMEAIVQSSVETIMARFAPDTE